MHASQKYVLALIMNAMSRFPTMATLLVTFYL